MGSVGAYEAKTHMARILRRVAKGERVALTRYGVTVAVIQPAEGPEDSAPGIEEIIRAIKAFRKGHRLDGLSLRELIDEGRR